MFIVGFLYENNIFKVSYQLKQLFRNLVLWLWHCMYVFLLDIYYCSINIRLCSGKIWGQHLPATLLLQLLPAPMYFDYQWIPVIFMFRSTHFWRIWISLGMLWTSMMNPFTIWTWAYNFKSFEVVWTTQGLSCGDMKACKWVMKDSTVYAYLRSIQGPRSLLWSWHPDPENVETCRVSSSCCKIWMSSHIHFAMWVIKSKQHWSIVSNLATPKCSFVSQRRNEELRFCHLDPTESVSYCWFVGSRLQISCAGAKYQAPCPANRNS